MLVSTCSGECARKGKRVWWALLAYRDGLVKARCPFIRLCGPGCFLLADPGPVSTNERIEPED